jgi:hypothetical protein
MGLDIHALNFLRYSILKRPLGNTLTIGRQHVHIRKKLELLLEVPKIECEVYFCDEILKSYLGATNVDSIDISNNDGATIIHDLNFPVERKLVNKYESIIDLGTSEHVFNVSQAIINYSDMVSTGGQIIHVLPADNFNGHGFYQFSPELFFSLYSEKRGYSELEIFIADLSDTQNWYKVDSTSEGERTLFSTLNPCYLLVKAVRRERLESKAVYQSDYLYAWKKLKNNPQKQQKNNGLRIINPLKNLFANYEQSLIIKILRIVFKIYKEISGNRFNNMKRVKVKELLN